jgi:hypothetical protein
MGHPNVYPAKQTKPTPNLHRVQPAKAEPSQVLEINDARAQSAKSEPSQILEINDARGQSAKSEPSHVCPTKQTKPTPGSSLQRLNQVRFWK